MVALLLMVQGVWAQLVEPSSTLTEITKMGSCMVYSFNYPSVSAAGKPTVLSAALFAWTPKDRQLTDSIEYDNYPNCRTGMPLAEAVFDPQMIASKASVHNTYSDGTTGTE